MMMIQTIHTGIPAMLDRVMMSAFTTFLHFRFLYNLQGVHWEVCFMILGRWIFKKIWSPFLFIYPIQSESYLLQNLTVQENTIGQLGSLQGESFSITFPAICGLLLCLRLFGFGFGNVTHRANSLGCFIWIVCWYIILYFWH